MKIAIPNLRTESESNRRDKWRAVERAKEQRERVGEALLAAHVPRDHGSYIVTLRRIAPKMLDGDNLRSALKAVQDSVATWICPRVDKLGRMSGDDGAGSPLVFRHEQRRGGVREYGVEIVIDVYDPDPSDLHVFVNRSGHSRCFVLTNAPTEYPLDHAEMRCLIVSLERALAQMADDE